MLLEPCCDALCTGYQKVGLKFASLCIHVRYLFSADAILLREAEKIAEQIAGFIFFALARTAGAQLNEDKNFGSITLTHIV